MSYGGNRNYGGSRGYGGGFGGPKPVETGKEYDVQIAEISRQGDGIARIQGFVIFVKGGKVGQKTKIKVTKVGDRFASAEVVSDSAVTQQSEKPKDIAPGVSEEEKPGVQEYKATEQGETKLE
jgi:predicted RNA-binding protein with TRAM domain